MSNDNPFYAARQYLQNVKDGRYGNKLTITDTTKSHIETVLGELKRWRELYQERADQIVNLDDENRELRLRLQDVEKMDKIVTELKEIMRG